MKTVRIIINAVAIPCKCVLVLLFMPVALYILMAADGYCDHMNRTGANLHVTESATNDLFAAPWRWAARRIL